MYLKFQCFIRQVNTQVKAPLVAILYGPSHMEKLIYGLVCEWLLFNAKWTIFLAISWREQVTFQNNDDDVRFVLDQHA
jgi:hypothetical protein